MVDVGSPAFLLEGRSEGSFEAWKEEHWFTVTQKTWRAILQHSRPPGLLAS